MSEFKTYYQTFHKGRTVIKRKLRPADRAGVMVDERGRLFASYSMHEGERQALEIQARFIEARLRKYEGLAQRERDSLNKIGYRLLELREKGMK